MRGIDAFQTAQREAEAAVAEADGRPTLLRSLGMDFESAKEYAAKTAADASGKLSIQVLTMPIRHQRALRTHLQAAWFGGAIIGGYLEGVNEKSPTSLLGYDELRHASSVINSERSADPMTRVMQELDLDGEATQQVASEIGLSLLPVLMDEVGIARGSAVEIATALATTWLDGVVVTIYALRFQLKSETN